MGSPSTIQGNTEQVHFRIEFGTGSERVQAGGAVLPAAVARGTSMCRDNADFISVALKRHRMTTELHRPLLA
jgi:hypothetical protein